MVNNGNASELESRAADMEKRLALLEMKTLSLDPKNEGTAAEGLEEMAKVTATAKSEVAKLKYQVMHLKRSLREAEIRDAEAKAKTESAKLRYRVKHLRRALQHSDRKAEQAVK
ncbi:hypothetical protein BSKO_00785 [Bryopsis sp. KO-2023]|nr:hypothetical protein BSKO_00785 [Bryopsis sp. KO-2023]